MISWRMAAAWVVALVLTTVLTWQIVGLADSQVGERPVAVAASLVTSSLVETTATTSPTSSTTTALTTTPPTGDTTSSSASTDSSSSSTSSTAAPAEWSVRTINSVGGSVVVRYRPGEVELQAATPASGFAVEIDDYGPPRVRVEFDSDGAGARIEVRWDNGALAIDVDEDD